MLLDPNLQRTASTSKNVGKRLPDHPHLTFLPYQEGLTGVNNNVEIALQRVTEMLWVQILAYIRHRTRTLKPPEDAKELLKNPEIRPRAGATEYFQVYRKKLLYIWNIRMVTYRSSEAAAASYECRSER